ncbi:MAG: UDP-N-acetylmuramyl-tripeptide synthetase, partial [Clostridiales bacterium]|nr:UDP-N-acetylmuramyl-tripeptide synthetase [Clostridiales bacterium]
MELCDVLENIDYEVIQYGKKPIDLLGVTIDSRKVKDGFMFVCISGANFDGHDYINSAAELGATAVVCERRDILFPPDITVALVPDTRKALNKLAENFYERAVCRMRVIGVTGTNGKTSTTYLLEASLAEAGIRTGVIGTSGARTNEGKIDIPYATSTTPDTLELHAIFAEMAKRGAEYAVMEVSSHALALDKVIGLNFAAAIFTNLTQDHLDFHGTMENYLEAKSKLFSLCQIGIINNDDPSAEYIKQHATCKIKTFSIKNESDYKAENVILTEAGVSFDL